MKLFACSLFALPVFLAAAVLPVSAAPSAAPPAAPQSVPQPLPPGVEATNLLLRGRRYERAMELLQAAIAARPADYSNYLALGCACADRVASLAHADRFTKLLRAEQKNYPASLKSWEDGQKDKAHYLYGSPRPKPLPTLVFPTLDDKVSFRLTEKQFAARLSVLIDQAQAAWAKADTLAKTDAEHAQIAWVRGCGMDLLRARGEHYELHPDAASPPDENADRQEVGAAPTPPDPALFLQNVPTAKAILAALRQATNLAPNNARYWQSLGDKESDTGKKAAAWEKSLALQPKNGPLWAALYQVTLNETYAPGPDFFLQPGAKPANTEKGVGYLKQAAKYDPANAWPWYEQAALGMHREMFSNYLYTRPGGPGSTTTPEDAQKAIQSDASQKAGRAVVALIEAGNLRNAFRPPHYAPPVPALMSLAGRYEEGNSTSFSYSLRLRELVRAVSGYALAAVLENKNLPEALRATQAIVLLGQKLAVNVPVKDRKGESRIVQASLGMTIAAMGFSNLAKIYAASGDDAARNAAQAEAETYQARATAYLQAALADDTLWEGYFE